MKKSKYTSFEYEEKEREELKKLYADTFPTEVSEFTGKDLKPNISEKVEITKLDLSRGLAFGENPFGQTIIIDIKKEEKSLRRLGYPSIDISVGQFLEVFITKDPSGSFNGSVSAGYEKALKNELHDSIKNENCAYSVKILEVCNGGFMVDLSGIKCFLPGSLAAANRIMNFSDYVGKEINVMVEVYDAKRDIFVVSFKKYLKKIIESEVQNLSFSQLYDGKVTGASNSGVFVEWEEIFTGIVQFDDANRSKLEVLKPGDPVSFYVCDIKNPNRIGISLMEPNERLKNIQELRDSSLSFLGENQDSKIYKGEIFKLKTFGAFVKLENGLAGLIEREKLLDSLEKYESGQLVNCKVSNVDLATFKIQLIEVE